MTKPHTVSPSKPLKHVRQAMQKRPFSSLYVHVPFCNTKCDYCAFYSLGTHDEHQRQAWLDKIIDDFHINAPNCIPLKSIFLGGGTPSALSLQELQRLLTAIKTIFPIDDGCEWSSEANPESLTNDKIRLMSDVGVNRFSLGIQSFNSAERKAIGRRGSLQRLNEITEEFRSCGITNFNFDLMFQLPGQTPESFAESLNQALRYGPSHVSAYALTLENDTPLARRTGQPNDEEFQQFWNIADQLLQKNGLNRYEISNFAMPGHRCIHNYNIWKGATYLGCGPAATSFDGLVRFTQPAALDQWLDSAPPEFDVIPEIERAAEILAFGMRTTDGWKWEEFIQLTGYHPMDFRKRAFHKLRDLGLITLSEDGASPTKQGLIFNDTVLSEILFTE